MKKLNYKDGLLYSEVTVGFRGKEIILNNVIVDTGSASCIFKIDSVMAIGLVPEPEDVLMNIRGVGGSEVVFSKTLDVLSLGEFSISNFQVQIGAMDYGFNIDGIIGNDFLIKTKSVIDLDSMRIYSTKQT